MVLFKIEDHPCTSNRTILSKNWTIHHKYCPICIFGHIFWTIFRIKISQVKIANIKTILTLKQLKNQSSVKTKLKYMQFSQYYKLSSNFPFVFPFLLKLPWPNAKILFQENHSKLKLPYKTLLSLSSPHLAPSKRQN